MNDTPSLAMIRKLERMEYVCCFDDTIEVTGRKIKRPFPQHMQRLRLTLPIPLSIKDW